MDGGKYTMTILSGDDNKSVRVVSVDLVRDEPVKDPFSLSTTFIYHQPIYYKHERHRMKHAGLWNGEVPKLINQ